MEAFALEMVSGWNTTLETHHSRTPAGRLGRLDGGIGGNRNGRRVLNRRRRHRRLGRLLLDLVTERATATSSRPVTGDVLLVVLLVLDRHQDPVGHQGIAELG